MYKYTDGVSPFIPSWNVWNALMFVDHSKDYNSLIYQTKLADEKLVSEINWGRVMC